MALQPWVVLTRLGFVQVFVNIPRQLADGAWYGREVYVFDPLTVKALRWYEALRDGKPRNIVMSSTIKYAWCLEVTTNGDVDIIHSGEVIITFCNRFLSTIGVDRNEPLDCTFFKIGNGLP